MVRERTFVDISEVPDQILAHAENPKDGFPPFTFKTSDGTTNYAFWLKDPSEFPGVIGDRLKEVWHDSLGVLVVVNPERDSYVLINHHGMMDNSWSIYNDGSGRKTRHCLGGEMSFPMAMPEPADMAILMGALEIGAQDGISIDSFDVSQLSPEQQAEVFLLGASTMVLGKGMAMTTKWQFITEAFSEVGVPGAGLGGGKSIALSPFDDDSRALVLEMMERA
ncbi:MAG: hypothetical protein Q7T11_00385, partial [Deltaproteobacteria bacterium]|nr:hypothetical protein [Deltaproteobacteria bacterium]